VNRRRSHINILLGCITAVFFVCWGPLIFYTILFEFRPDILPAQTVMASVGYTLSLLFGMLTPIANPVFYGLLNDPFKEVMRAKFPWLFCVRSNSVIGNLTMQSLALTLPAMPKRNRFKISIDETRKKFSIEKSVEESEEGNLSTLTSRDPNKGRSRLREGESRDIERRNIQSRDVESRNIELRDVENRDIECRNVESRDVVVTLIARHNQILLRSKIALTEILEETAV
jgi:hypothetical protein